MRECHWSLRKMPTGTTGIKASHDAQYIKRRARRSFHAEAKPSLLLAAGIRPNENKIRYGYRRRGLLEMTIL